MASEPHQLSKATQLDAHIIGAAQRGDEGAHAAIYSAYAARIFTLIYRLVQRRAQAEDLLQDTFVEVLRSIASFSGNGSFEGWLRSIAVNKCLMLLRSPWHRSRTWLDESFLRPDELRVNSAPPLDASLIAQSELETALRHLSPLSRTVVWLHDVEGYTHIEIARALGRTSSFSKSQLARAHHRLRELLAGGAAADAVATVPNKSTTVVVANAEVAAHEEILPCTPAAH